MCEELGSSRSCDPENKDHFKKFMDSLIKQSTKMKALKREIVGMYSEP